MQPAVSTVAHLPDYRGFDQLYARWFRDVVRWLYALGVPDGELEDVAQEVFIVAQRKLKGLEISNPQGWLYRIASRTASDQRRRSWFKHLFSKRSAVALEQLRHGDRGPAELLERREEQRILHRLVSQLSSKHRATFVLFEIEGYSGDEIAAMQQIPVATVWTRLHYARRDFFALVAKQLEKGGG